MSGSKHDELWKGYIINPHHSWDDPFKIDTGHGASNKYSNWGNSKSKKLHKYIPVLLIFTTAYNCEHCGAKKEDCKTDYCEEKEDYNLDIGEWG